ncbi:divalent-cation tolerance protein CutA [Parvularcula maris]|uniref:Divalent-cation tolerance protein CutA n=1 Tax=Parvularcula maris TaxID=2965077 RepID=A0A9X2RIL1_9PROT|nr:divalent-cation tolerance protein CutA [Parvularcula maris]MCQ8183977.1 divalent-cation tolerance protein CutA [Parvularcula maris]
MTLSLLITTMGSREEAESLAREMLGQRLAACVQLEPITSLYRWEGSVEFEEEVRMTFKTTTARVPALRRAVLEEHPYDEPEIIVLEAAGASDGYAAWVEKEVKGTPAH